MRRIATVVAIAVVTLVSGGDTAGAVPGHRSCAALGHLIAEEAQTGVLVPELQSYDRGTVDDVIALVQVGGTFGDEQVPAFCLVD